MSGDVNTSDRPVPAIDPLVLEALWAHAEAGYPEEVCGVLIGTAGGAILDEARRCENRQNALHAEDPLHYPRDARTAYMPSDADLLFISYSERTERPVRVIYHSHVDVGAYFSEEDKRQAVNENNNIGSAVHLVFDNRELVDRQPVVGV